MKMTLRRIASLCLVTAVGVFAIGCEPQGADDLDDTTITTEEGVDSGDEMIDDASSEPAESDLPPASPDGSLPATTEPTESDPLEPAAPVEQPDAPLEDLAPTEEPAAPVTDEAVEDAPPAEEAPVTEEPAAEQPASDLPEEEPVTEAAE